MRTVDNSTSSEVVLGKTGFGKTLLATKHRSGRTWTCKFREGGRLPKLFTGTFTDFPTVQRLANIYFKT